MPPLPPRLLLPVAATILLLVFLQLGVLSIAFEKLALSPDSAYLLLGVTLVGSLVNLPVGRVRSARPPPEALPRALREFFGLRRPPFTGWTVIAVNVGGCVVPVAFSAYLIAHNPIDPLPILLAVGAVAVVSYATSSPVAGVGIAMPFLVAPLTAALAASVFDPPQRAALAYIGGTLGVLVGADLMRLRQIGTLGAPVAAIGGAGTFDGIFLSGLLAVLLA